MPPKHYSFCFTHHNYSKDDIKKYEELYKKKHYFQFLAFGMELCPETNTPHLQGYFWLNESSQAAHVKRKMKGAWVGVPGREKGPVHHLDDDSITGFGYVFKEHQPGWIMLGVRPTEAAHVAQAPAGQGKRKDLIEVKKKIDAGVPIDAIMEEEDHFTAIVQHSKFFEQYQSYKRRRTKWSPPEVHVTHGPTGTFKSRSAWDTVTDPVTGEYDMGRFFKLAPAMCGSQNTWFDGYNGQEIVLIEEFRPGHMKYGELLDLTDGYPSKMQIKGSTVHWSPKKIYITSPVSPYDWYPNLTAHDSIDQLLRRITSITNTESR